ncbi:MAG: glycosyltransferase [Planctomycetota bacterium]
MTGRRAVVFAGGGTGGHLFPAVAIAERLVEQLPGATLRFWCSDRSIDARILAQQTVGGELVAFDPLPAKPVGARPGALLRFLRSWGPSVREARARLRELKSAHDTVQLVATGGFVAAPAVQAARVERVPVTLVNLDATPGKANRWAARHARRVFNAADGGPDPWERVRPLVRAQAVGGDAARCREALGLDPDRPTLLITGGSQGARSINDMVAALLGSHAEAFSAWQCIHQCGDEAQADPLARAYDGAGIDAIVRPFFAEVGLCWGAASAALGRAGAGTVAEAWANRVPTLFMPYPWHRDEHQARNAAVLVDPGASEVVRDLREGNANAGGAAGDRLLVWLQDPGVPHRLADRFSGLPEPDGADQIASSLL